MWTCQVHDIQLWNQEGGGRYVSTEWSGLWSYHQLHSSVIGPTNMTANRIQYILAHISQRSDSKSWETVCAMARFNKHQGISFTKKRRYLVHHSVKALGGIHVFMKSYTTVIRVKSDPLAAFLRFPSAALGKRKKVARGSNLNRINTTFLSHSWILLVLRHCVASPQAAMILTMTLAVHGEGFQLPVPSICW